MSEMMTFSSPKTIHFGYGALDRIVEEAKKVGEKALIITDKVMLEVGHVEKCEQLLHHAQIKTYVYDGVDSEPKDVFVDEALALFNEQTADFIISLGGGSCIDTAKALSVLATNNILLPILVEPNRPLAHDPIAHIAIPTTAGTGSEVTDVTVITNTTTDVKMMMKNHAFITTAAIIDPTFTLTCPKSVIVGTGVDAFCHAIEAYISKRAHQITDTFALSAMELIINNIELSYNDKDNREAKEAMSLASMQAGLAFSNASVCLIHGMSRPIGALFNVPHGMSNAMLLPAVLNYSKEACLEELAIVGRMFNPDIVDHDMNRLATYGIEQIETLNRNLQIGNIESFGVKREIFLQAIDKMVTDAFASGSPANHPLVPTKEEMKQIYMDSYDY